MMINLANFQILKKWKVSFPSQKNQIIYFDPKSAPFRPLQIKNPTRDPTKKKWPTKQRQRKTYKMIYQVKSLIDQNFLNEKSKARIWKKKKKKKETTIVDSQLILGLISPLPDTEISSPNQILSTPQYTSPIQSKIIKDDVDLMPISDQEITEVEEDNQKIDDQNKNNSENELKLKLVILFSENNLKLAPKHNCGDLELADRNIVVETVENFVNLADGILWIFFFLLENHYL